MKNLIKNGLRTIDDFFTGRHTYNNIKEIEPHIRELCPETLPLDEEKEILALKMIKKSIKTDKIISRYVQPIFTGNLILSAYLYSVEKYKLDTLLMSTGFTLAFKGILYGLTRYGLNNHRNLRRGLIDDLTSAENIAGEEWKKEIGYD